MLKTRVHDYKMGLIQAEIMKSGDQHNKMDEILEFLGHDITTIHQVARDAVYHEVKAEMEAIKDSCSCYEGCRDGSYDACLHANGYFKLSAELKLEVL